MTTRSALWNAAATSAAMLLILLFVDPAGRAPEWARFMARQHPAIVHLPIGFLLFGGLLAAFRRWQKRTNPDVSSRRHWSSADGVASRPPPRDRG